LIPASIFAARYENSSDIAKTAFQRTKLQQELGVCTSLTNLNKQFSQH